MATINEKSIAPVVYVVDDDDGMRRALDTLLSTVGYRTAVYSRPSEFLANFKVGCAGLSGAGYPHAGYERPGIAAASESSRAPCCL
jgi:hypothetical protein